MTRSCGAAVAVAVLFVWLGMVLAISFLETPLKFRAPGVTLRIGLGIGRLVFRALNGVELVLGLVIVAVLVVSRLPAAVVVASATALAALAVQLTVIRPALNRRTNAVLAGLDAPRSRGHYAYVGLELVKAIALAVAGICLVSS